MQLISAIKLYCYPAEGTDNTLTGEEKLYPKYTPVTVVRNAKHDKSRVLIKTADNYLAWTWTDSLEAEQEQLQLMP